LHQLQTSPTSGLAFMTDVASDFRARKSKVILPSCPPTWKSVLHRSNTIKCTCSSSPNAIADGPIAIFKLDRKESPSLYLLVEYAMLCASALRTFYQVKSGKPRITLSSSGAQRRAICQNSQEYYCNVACGYIVLDVPLGCKQGKVYKTDSSFTCVQRVATASTF